MKRTIIKINETLCNGCGACVSGCHEGALQLINGKAVMVSDLYCDGLGACIGDCPVGAITLEEREAEPYNEAAVMERISPKGEAVILAHLNHLKEHGETGLMNEGLQWLATHNIKINMDTTAKEPLACGCPGSMMRDLRAEKESSNTAKQTGNFTPVASELRQFPVQLQLLNPSASFLQGSDLLLAADCTAFSCGDFHQRFLKGKALAIACPKLDSNIPAYIDKLATMIDMAKINTLTVLVMEVPCCSGLIRIAQVALEKAQRNVPLKVIELSVSGDIISEEWALR